MITAAFLVSAQLGSAKETKPSANRPPKDNPLLKESALPYRLPLFDRIKDKDYGPAFEAGMAEELREVDAIAKNTDKPTFENTIVALERSGQTLARIQRVFSNLAATNTNPTLQKIEGEMAPKLAAHNDAIRLNPALFARVQSVYEQRDTLGLDPESKWLLERYYKDFVHAGAKLSGEEKEKLKALNLEIASVQITFEQNVQKEKNASSIVVDQRADLAGLPENQIATAAATAKGDHKEGKFVLPLSNTSGQPILHSLENRALRERIMKASLSRNSKGGEFDNRAVVIRLARLRAQQAQVLGFANHGAYQLDEQTAGNVETVNKLLGDLAPPAVRNARREAADLQAVVDQEHGGFQVAPWDWAFYSEKVRKARHAFDESQLRPYFEWNHVLSDGIFFAATQLYGITFKERHDLPVYQPDVRVFEVFNPDGQPFALFLCDPFARPSKRGGAWMHEYVTQNKLLGTKPVVAVHLNIPKPAAGEACLLTPDELRTAFHEFGHALHGMFSQVQYPRFSGTSVPRDFGEYPAQVNEMWLSWPEVLKNYAKHYKTGEPMPLALLEKMLTARKFNQGFATTEYIAASLLDQAWHQLTPDQIPSDALGFEEATLKKAGVDFALVPPRYRTTYFSHAFNDNGYSAGYYSYLWSEVLDADSVEWFKQHGGLKRENGDRFRQTLLSRGGSAESISLFRNFTGTEPDIAPLLKRRGLDTDHPDAPLKTEASN
ncbi:MAG TPA: M3 family metallopeptidase [Chthoniobacterales bacterium]|nr:M3 family metallopeptidase [Chthoniobacterales bacterium]